MDERLRERRIRTALDREAGHVVPRANLWPAIERQLRHKQAVEAKAAGLRPRPPERRFAPRPAFAFVALLLVASLAVAITLPAWLNRNLPAPPSSPAVTQAPTVATNLPAPGLMPPALLSYAQPLGLSQTVDSYSVTLDRIYFDASILMVSYRIAGPHTRYLSAMGDLGYLSSIRHSAYTDSDVAMPVNNDSLNFLSSQGWQVNNQGVDGATVDGIASFDPPTGVTNSLALRLSLNLTRNPAIDINSVSPPLTPNLAQEVAGPFDFNFTAPPVSAQKTINIGKQVTSSGVNVTLEQVSLTPGATQLLLRFSGAGFNPNIAWQPDLTMNPAGQQIGPDAAIEVRKQADGSWLYVSHAALYDHPGPCTVTITALHGYDNANPSASEVQLNGPWTFQFTIPPP